MEKVSREGHNNVLDFLNNFQGSCYPGHCCFEESAWIASSGIMIIQGQNAYRKSTLHEYEQDIASKLPDGIFHYINRETESDANFKLPHFDGTQINPMTVAGELLNAVSSAKQNEEEFTGINIPMPFGMKPLKVQLDQKRNLATRMGHPESEQESTTESPAPLEMDWKSQKALKNARIACLSDDQSACDQALERYHQIRYHRSPVIETKKIRDLMLEQPENIVTNGLLKWLMPNLKTLT